MVSTGLISILKLFGAFYLASGHWRIFQQTFLPSVADPDPGSGAFLTPGSGIRKKPIPDPGSQIHIFESLVTIFWVKSSIIL
jgi:hypothetical protein